MRRRLLAEVILFNFTGKINKLTITVEPPKLTPEDEQKLSEGEKDAADAKETRELVGGRSW